MEFRVMKSYTIDNMVELALAPRAVDINLPQIVKLRGERFGTEGEFTMHRHLFHIKTERVGVVDYPVNILKREDNPQWKIEGDVGEGPKQALLMSGFATEAADWLRMADEQFRTNPALQQLTLLDHPSSAPTVVHEKKNVALNDKSFKNSADVINQALDQLKAKGEIQDGQVAIGLSTGTAVLTELAAMNPKRIDTLVLVAPAGLLDRTQKLMKDGAQTGGTEYMMQFFDGKPRRSLERLRDLGKTLREEKKQDPTSPVIRKFLDGVWQELQENYIAPLKRKQEMPPQEKQPTIMMVDKIPDVQEGYWNTIGDKKIDPQAIRKNDLLFEFFFDKGRKFPRLWQHFTGMWGDARPHVPIENTDYKKDFRLIAKDKNAYKEARQTINNKKIIVVMGMEDGAVPPEEFLTMEDKREIRKVTDVNEKGELSLGRIIQRVKEKFPNNADTTVMLTVGGPSGHVQEKTETELYGFTIARILGALEPPKQTITYKKESSWQAP